MSKQPDFGKDLATLDENVTASVGDVLQALQQKREPSRPAMIQKRKEPVAIAAQSSVTEAPSSLEQPAVSQPSRRQRSTSRSRLAVVVEEDEPLKNVTTRLRRSTDKLLTEASLRQQLKKASPDSRQAIIEEAVNDWFRKHGYDRSREEHEAETEPQH